MKAQAVLLRHRDGADIDDKLTDVGATLDSILKLADHARREVEEQHRADMSPRERKAWEATHAMQDAFKALAERGRREVDELESMIAESRGADRHGT